MFVIDFIREHHLNIMLSLGNISGAVALSMLISGLRTRRQWVMFFLELGASLLLISDRFIWIYEGSTSPTSMLITRVSAFVCFESTIAVFLAINLYMQELFRANRELDPNLKRFYFNSIVLIIGAILVSIFHFNGLYYYFDETNTYQEGPLYMLATLIPFITLMVDVSLIIQFFKKLERNVRTFLLIFAIIPVLDPLWRMLLPNMDTTDISFSFMAAMLYSIDLFNTHRAAEVSIRAIARSEAKSTFLSNMSHEIRTPLNSVLGMNEMILRECKDPKILAYSEDIKSSGNTLLGLINDILDFSKIEAGKIEIIPVDYGISSIIHDLESMIRPKTDSKGLELKFDIDSSLPGVLNGDEIRVKQVITNILTNAAKYTEKGSVTLSVSCKSIDRDNNLAVIRVSVSDTGIGIKPEDMDKLFAKFERIEEKRNRKIEGTGLGMSITMSLLEMMGSKLEVKSVYGQGSVFSFDLEQRVVSWDPIGDYEQSYRNSLDNKEKYKEKLRAPEARILVVDDSKMNLKVFKHLVRDTQIQTDTAESGDDCLKLVSENAYDIIFLDIMMPQKSGTETLVEMKAQSSGPNHSTPVVCLTADAISGAREKYISVGFTDYLTKPIHPEQLEEMLIKLLPKEKCTRI